MKPQVVLTKHAAEAYQREFSSFLEAVAELLIKVVEKDEPGRLLYLGTALNRMVVEAYAMITGAGAETTH